MNLQSKLKIWKAVCVALFCFAMGSPSFAQDSITVRDQRTGRYTTFKAKVMDWDAQRLVYESNERQNQIASSRVVKVEYAFTELHQQAREQLQQGRLPQALDLLNRALTDEPREWVKRDIRAEQIKAASGMGQQREALTAFFELINSSQQTRHFHLIPIPWEKVQVDVSLVDGLRNWLASEDDVQKMVAASWLFHSDREPAVAALQALTSSPDSRVAHLATGQLWRQKTVDVRESDLQLWQVALARMPESLQAGPRFRIAEAKLRLAETASSGDPQLDANKKQQAVIGFMQIPILFPEQYQLCGSALARATQLLIAEGKTTEANIVKTELTTRFRFSIAALKSSSEIQNLDR